MPKIQNIINAGDLIMSKGENTFLKSTRGIEPLILAALMEIFKNVDISNGKLSSSPKAEEFLASLDARVFASLRSAGYGDIVKEFVTNYDLMSDNVQELHEALGNGLIPRKDINAVKRLEVAKVIDGLTEQGLYKDFISPIRQGLYRNILFGATVDETEEFIRSQVISTKKKDSKLIRYVGQVATDGLHQYDGSINQVAKTSLDLNATQYVGSLIEDSRAQCMKWVSMSIIKDEDLESEIKFALDKSFYGNKKCSGMIDGTNPSNFCIHRGGYRCRHRAIPIRLVKRKK